VFGTTPMPLLKKSLWWMSMYFEFVPEKPSTFS
jgi:hypothetical protein